MEVKIIEAKTKKQMREFVEFPMKLYAQNPNFVPSLIADELETLDPKENPVFEHAEGRYFLALQGNKVVGRIAAIINTYETENQGKPKIRFGWFDFIDNPRVSKALLQQVEEIGKQKNLEFMEGPVGFSNLERAGLLTKGYDRLATIVTNYNHPYYEKHLMDLGFEPASVWVEYRIKVPNELPEKVLRFAEIVMQRYDLHVIKFKNKEQIAGYAEAMFKLLDETYSSLETYVPFSPKQIDYYKKRYIKFIHPDYLCCLADKEGNLKAFAIAMPSYSKAMQKAKGKLFPFGWYHLMQAARKNDEAAFYLIGVHPALQGKGVTAVIFKEMMDTFRKNNIKFVETNPELENNKNIQLLWKDYEKEQHKTRKSYRKGI